MKITVFGAGSSTPTTHKPLRSHASFGIKIDHDFLLFDIGPGTISKMLQAGVDVAKNPSHLFISHYHLDHCLDYVTLAKDRALLQKNQGSSRILEVFGPEGLGELSNDLFRGVKKWNYMTDELKVFDMLKLKETMHGVAKITKAWQVSCAPIKHYNGVCYRLDAEGKSIVYSGDMAYDETLATLGEDADIAILECSYPNRKELKGLHLCPEEIGQLAKLGRFRHVVLTHLYPACEGEEEKIIRTIKHIASCEVTIASDFFSLSL